MIGYFVLRIFVPSRYILKETLVPIDFELFGLQRANKLILSMVLKQLLFLIGVQFYEGPSLMRDEEIHGT